MPKVRCKSRHDPEIQGRFPAFSDGPVDVMGKVGRETLERNFFATFLHDSYSRVFQTLFSYGWRYLEVQSSFAKQYHWGGWRCWLRIVIEWHHPSGKL